MVTDRATPRQLIVPHLDPASTRATANVSGMLDRFVMGSTGTECRPRKPPSEMRLVDDG